MDSLRDLVLALDDRPVTPVEVPEWGLTLHVRALTLAERLALAGHTTDGMTPFSVLVAVGACDEAGARVFTLDDVPALDLKNAAAIERVGKAVMAANRLGEADTEAARKN